jgi:UrcA family protein
LRDLFRRREHKSAMTDWETAMNTSIARCTTPCKALGVLMIGALASVGLESAARADSPPEPRSVTVHFEDLNTNNAHGAAALYSRIKTAAEDVCRDLTRTRSLALLSRYSQCVRSAIGAAVGQVNRPLVTEYALIHRAPAAAAPIKVKVARNS